MLFTVLEVVAIITHRGQHGPQRAFLYRKNR